MVYEVPDNRAGQKVVCGNAKCRWHIEIPTPVQRKQTVLGELLDSNESPQAKDWRTERPPVQQTAPPSNPSPVSQPLKEQPERGQKGPDEKYCVECGSLIRARAEICPRCGVRQPSSLTLDLEDPDDSPIRNHASTKITAEILAIVLGCLGVHKFVLGYTGPGILMLLVSIVGVFCYFLGPLVMETIGLIEGIIYLTKSDREFYEMYILRKRFWF